MQEFKNILIANHDKTYLANVNIKDSKINIETLNKNNNEDYEYILMPFFIDSHSHGGYGFDFNDFKDNDYEQKWNNYLNNLKHEGVGLVSVSTVSDTLENLSKASINIKKELNKNMTLGWHIEGPFLSLEKKGAHDPNTIIPIDEKFLEQIKSFPLKVNVTVAPEINNNLDIISRHYQDFIFSLGHSNANYEITKIAIENKYIKKINHLYNQMGEFKHRDLSTLNALFDYSQIIKENGVLVELISDGHHVDNHLMLYSAKVYGYDNLAIISDSMPTKGLPDGDYFLGPVSIEKKGYVSYIKDNGNLAGSNSPYNIVLKNFKLQTGCSWSQLVKVANYNVAKFFKVPTKYCGIQNNQEANFIVINKDFEIISFYKDGKNFIF